MELTGITDPVPPAISCVERRHARQKIAIFLSLVAASSISLYLLRLLIPFGTDLIAVTWTPRLADALGMWSVGLAGLIALAMIDRSVQGIGFALPPARYLILASTVPLIYCAAIYVPVWTLGLGSFAGASRLFAGIQSALIHFPIRLFVAAGEEFGWRGALVPNLARAADFKYVVFLPGVIWALWHYPDILFFDYNVGTPPMFAVACFSIFVVGLSIFFSWLRLASDSIWPAVILHAVHNSVIWSIFDGATEHDRMATYITTEFGAGAAVAGAVVGYLFGTKLKITYDSIHQSRCTNKQPARRI
jgi:uncharacterized protein